MRTQTREKFNAYTAQVAQLSAVASAVQMFTVEPSVQQTLETKMQDSVAFLGMINLIPVDELKGEKVGIGISGTIAGRTDTSADKERDPSNPTALQNHKYECHQTNFDTYITYGTLDAWAKFPDFQIRVRDAILTRQGLDRIMIGFNGVSAAATTNRTTNPLLQDVNIGWVKLTKTDAPAQVISEVTAASGKIHVNATKGDYKNLDALVYDLVSEKIAPWYADDTDLVVLVGRKLLSDKYFPIISDAADNQNALAGQVLVSQKQIGGLKAIRVPFVPDGTLIVTKLSNLSIYYQLEGRRRMVEEEPKKNRIVNWESSNDAYVVEDYDCIAIAENITFEAKA